MEVDPFLVLVFFFNDTATTEIYTLSLHDALPISRDPGARPRHRRAHICSVRGHDGDGAHLVEATRRRPRLHLWEHWHADRRGSHQPRQDPWPGRAGRIHWRRGHLRRHLRDRIVVGRVRGLVRGQGSQAGRLSKGPGFGEAHGPYEITDGAGHLLRTVAGGEMAPREN